MTKKLQILLLIIGAGVSIQFISIDQTPQQKAEQQFKSDIKKLTNAIVDFEKSCVTYKDSSSLKGYFATMRLSYKNIAHITEYYFPFQTKYINAPALPWVLDDDPTILKPYGLQVIEELVYSETQKPDTAAIFEHTKKIKIILNEWEKAENYSNIFSPNYMLEGCSQSLIRLMSMGITGFDSPIANQSIPEAVATLKGVKTYLEMYIPSSEYNIMQNTIESAIAYIASNNDFNSFDRLYFIRTFLNPLYDQLTKYSVKNDYGVDNDRSPINKYVSNFFDSNFFNINAFAPTSKYRPTAKRIELGKKLFYDNILSTNGLRNCASCHKPEMAFTDGLATAYDLKNQVLLLRNTPTLYNSAYQTKFFFDSRSNTLENQINNVVHNRDEMGGSFDLAIDTLERNKEYQKMFELAYQDDYKKITAYNIANALGSYVRSLSSFNSRFDRYMRGENVKLSSMEKSGFNLFMGKAKCGTCHYAPLFSGLVPPFFSETESEIIGVPSSNNKNVLDADLGKGGFTKISIHNYAFKTPTIRNISKTGPYMHNGVFKTLSEVLDFYNKGGGTGVGLDVPNQTLPSEQLLLTKKEKQQIISFMRTLDESK